MDSPSVKLLFNGVMRGLNNPKGKRNNNGLLLPPTPFPSPAHSPGDSPMLSKYIARKHLRRESSSGLSTEYQKEMIEFLKLSELYLQNKSEKFVKEDFLKQTRDYLEVLETEIGHQDGSTSSRTHSIVDYLHYLKAVIVQIVDCAEFRDSLIEFAESVQAYMDQDFESSFEINKSMTEQGVEVKEGTFSDFEKMDAHMSHFHSNFNHIIGQFRARFTKTNETKTASMGLLFLADCWQSLFTPENFELQLPETVHRLTFLARDLLVFSARNENNLVADLESSVDSLVYHVHKKSEKFSNWMKSFLLFGTQVICCDRSEDAHTDLMERSMEVLNDPEFKEDIFRFLTASINLLKVINSNDNIQCAWRNALLKLMRIKVQSDEMFNDLVKALSNVTKLPLPPIIVSDDTFYYQLVDPIVLFDNLMPSSFTSQCDGDVLIIKIEPIEGKLENVQCSSTRKDLPLITDEASLSASFNFGAEIRLNGGEWQSLSLHSIKCTISGLSVEARLSVPNENLQLGLQSMLERVIVDVMQDVSGIAKQFYESIYEAASTSQSQSSR